MSERLLQRRLLIGLGLGIGLGAAAASLAMYLLRTRYGVSSEIGQLAAKIDCLQREVHELRTSVEFPDLGAEDSPDTLQLSRPDSFFSLPGSSDDEEDEFLDSYDVNNDRYDLQAAESLTSEDFLSADEDATDAGNLFKRVDSLLDGGQRHQDEAYRLLSGIESTQRANPSYLWRMAKATYLKSQVACSQGDQEQRKSLIYNSERFASAALQLQQDDANIHKWCAITLGSVGDFESVQVKIQNGYKFKEHITKAIQLSPSDPSAHYLLGRWCFGVYQLSWIERKVAATLFATPPSATIDEALEHFLEAEKLQPGQWKDNLLYVAKCYIEKGEYPEANQWLNKAKAAAIIGQDGKIAEQEVTSLLQKYGSYT